MSEIPMRRAAAAKALSDAGYPIMPATLATMKTRGGGPPYTKFGRVVLYRWDELLAWAKGREKLGAAGGNTVQG